MSTSQLCRMFSIRGYRYVKTEFVAGGMIVTMERRAGTYSCSACGSKDVRRQGAVRRMFRTVPIGSRWVMLAVDIPRVLCRNCGKTRQVRVGFAGVRRSYARAFERFVLDLGRHMTIKDVARHLGVSWDMVKGIMKRHLRKHYSKPRLKHLKLIAIDEISVGKRHRYVTLVMDLESGAVVFVGDGKGADALDPFWKRLRASHARIEAVATDMSPAYIDAVTRHLPNATLVFDRFHVIKLYNDKLTELRRELYREVAGTMKKRALKGVRRLLLKRPEHLDDSETAQALLMDWIVYAESTGIRMLQKFAKALRLHALRILNYYDYPISTGPLEGTSNKIKTMKRQAYGFRDHEFLILKIQAIHKTRYALVG